jgi:hypothetical protein
MFENVYIKFNNKLKAIINLKMFLTSVKKLENFDLMGTIKPSNLQHKSFKNKF